MSSRWTVLLIASFALAGCTSKVEKARQQLAFLEQQKASYGEICRAARAVADADSEARDPSYSQDAAIAGIDCLTADQLGAEASAADNALAVADDVGNMTDNTSNAMAADMMANTQLNTTGQDGL